MNSKPNSRRHLFSRRARFTRHGPRSLAGRHTGLFQQSTDAPLRTPRFAIALTAPEHTTKVGYQSARPGQPGAAVPTQSNACQSSLARDFAAGSTPANRLNSASLRMPIRFGVVASVPASLELAVLGSRGGSRGRCSYGECRSSASSGPSFPGRVRRSIPDSRA